MSSKKLPEGWKVRRLGDVLQKTSNIDPRKTPDEDFTYIDVSSVSRTTFSIKKTTRLKGKDAPSRARKKVETGDVLFATIRPTLQRIAIVPKIHNGEVCSTGFFVLRPNKEIENHFLYYYLFTDTFMSEIEKRQKGASYPAVNNGDVQEQIIAFPPLPEQKRIVAILDKAFEGINQAVEGAEKNLANGRELFESYLNTIFTQKGEGWVEKKLKSIGSIINGYAFKSKDFDEQNGVKCIKITNVGVRHFVPNTSSLLPAGFDKQYKKVQVSAGSIVIALTRSIISDGLKVALVPKEYDGALLNQRVASCVVANDDHVFQRYLYYYLCSAEVVYYVKRKANTLMQPNLSITDLKNLIVPVPPLSIQKSIVDAIQLSTQKTQHLQFIYNQKLSALQELKQSILQKAFSGELTTDHQNQKECC